MAENSKLLLTIQQTADLLNFSPRLVWQMLRAGELPGVQLRHGKRTTWRVSFEMLEAWIRNNTTGGSTAVTKGGE